MDLGLRMRQYKYLVVYFTVKFSLYEHLSCATYL